MNFIFLLFRQTSLITPPNQQMEDQQDPTPASTSPPAASPTSNQNLILGIVMGAVVLLLLLLVITQQFGGQGDESKDPKLTEMQKESAELKAKIALMVSTSGNNQTTTLLVEGIKRDVGTLGAIVEQNQQNVLALKDSRATIQSLTRQLADLQRRDELNGDAATRVTGLEAQIKALTAQLDGAVDQTTMTALRDQLTASKDLSQQLQEELTALKTKSGRMIDGNQLAAVRTELDECLAENTLLKLELQKLRTKLDGARLFVTRENLSPKAQKFFRELERLEGIDQNGLEQAYERIKKEFNAHVVETAAFAIGSADLKQEHEAQIKGVTVESNPNSFFLVVGYASKTGDIKSNRDLSERRSKRVASTVNYLKQNSQEVQAVYLGETDRFGEKAQPNQICEVWEIRP